MPVSHCLGAFYVSMIQCNYILYKQHIQGHSQGHIKTGSKFSRSLFSTSKGLLPGKTQKITRTTKYMIIHIVLW